MKKKTMSRLSTIAHNIQVLEELKVDNVWAANQVDFDLITTTKGKQIVAYYDVNRMMTVGIRDTRENSWVKTILPSQLVWDSHNFVRLGIDKRGYIHLSGNMHVRPLIYFRSALPYEVSQMTEINSMIGEDEDRVTYPCFFHDKAGDLYFSYRNGSFGDGSTIINKYDIAQERWKRHLSVPLFSKPFKGKHKIAYQKSILGIDGRFHFIWMWRSSPLVETCHQLCYASSINLLDWQNSAGVRVEPPFRPDTDELTVDDVPERSGLHNGRQLIIVDKHNDPVICYVKDDQHGCSQIFAAKPNKDGWHIVQLSSWEFKWEFHGQGDKMSEGIAFNFLGFAHDELIIDYRTPEGEVGQFFLNTEKMELGIKKHELTDLFIPNLYEAGEDESGMYENWRTDNIETLGRDNIYLLRWLSRPKSHGKHAPDVIPNEPIASLNIVKVSIS